MNFCFKKLDIMNITWICVLSAAFILGGVQSTNELENDVYDDTRHLPFQFDSYYNMPKRAGFVGMRGKKDMDDEESLEKLNEELPLKYGQFLRQMRAGFVGMRGKKDDEFPSGKRAGFVGMRGKKADYIPFWYPRHYDDGLEHSKSRRANSGFVGMRGK